MADTVTVDNADAAFGDFVVATDDAGASGHVQIMKLAYSADGSAVLVPADASGIKCNLGADNDVVLAAGTAEIGKLAAGTAAIGKLAANSGVDIGDVTLNAGTAEIGKLAAGTAAIGLVKVNDGTTTATVTITGGTNEGLAVAIIDDAGDALSFAAPAVLSATPTLSTTPAYEANEAMDTDDLEFANAAAVAGGTGHILRATFIDTDDLVHDGTYGAMYLDVYSAAVTGMTENSAYAVTSAAIAATYVGTIDTDDGVWRDLGVAKVCTVKVSPPLPYNCAATTLFGALVAKTDASGVAAADGLIVKLHVVKD